MMSKSGAKWLLLVLILTPLVAKHHQVASRDLPDDSHESESVVYIHWPPYMRSTTERPLEITTPKPVIQPKATKFIILTTGEQIKLYPLVPDLSRGPRASQDLKPTENYYLLDINNHNNQGKQRAGDDSQELTMKPGNNSFSQSLLEQQKKRTAASGQQVDDDHHHDDSRKRNGNTNNYAFYDSDYRSADSSPELERKKPWIVDVDYFFDTDYCHFFRSENQFFDPEPHDCLVIVWLDKNNKLVHYGSVNLATNPMTTLTTSSASKTNNWLPLREFAPISVGESIFVASENKKQLAVASQVYGMVIDKKRRKLYVAFSDGSKPYANRILSGGLIPARNFPSSESQLRDETTLHFNECLDSKPSSQLTDTTFDNLSIDEDIGDWLFFLNRAQGGKIIALNVNPKKGSGPTAPQALVKNFAPYGWSDPPYQYQLDTQVIGMAMDPKSQRLIWLTQGKRLQSCDYAGSDEKYLDSLSEKPAIRSSQSMQVLHDTLYISDPIKNTLIAYRLTKLEPSDSETFDDRIWRLKEMVQTHRVLLVEMPSIYGFRVVDIEAIFGEIEEKSTNSLDKLKAKLADLSSNQTNISVGDSVVSNSTKLKTEYNHLLLNRSCSQCGYEQSDLGKHTRYSYDFWLFILFEGSLLLIAFFSLWYLFVKLNQYVKAKEESSTKKENP